MVFRERKLFRRDPRLSFVASGIALLIDVMSAGCRLFLPMHYLLNFVYLYGKPYKLGNSGDLCCAIQDNRYEGIRNLRTGRFQVMAFLEPRIHVSQ